MKRLALTAPVIAFVPVSADTLHVPSQHPTIQRAINAAADGDLILVAPGTYHEALDLLGKRITLRGGGADVTTLDGSTLPDTILWVGSGETFATVIEGFTFTNGKGVPVAPGPCPMVSISPEGGGAMVVSGASAITVRDCDFVHNAIDQGLAGGAIVVQEAGLRMERCYFFDNGGFTSNFDLKAPWGGGILACTSHHSIELVDCIFERNGPCSFGTGALIVATVPVTLDGCAFRDNASSFGGGLFLFMHSGPDPRATITNCVFIGNSAGFGGGALLQANGLPEDFDNPGDNPVIVVRRCEFRENSVEAQPDIGVYSTVCNRDGGDGLGGPGNFYGSAMDLRTLNAVFGDPIIDVSDCLIADGGFGPGGRSGVHVAPCQGGQTFITNTTFVGNPKSGLHIRLNNPQQGLDVYPTLISVRNSILWGNGHGALNPRQIAINQDSQPLYTFEVSHSIVQNGWPGAAILDADPLFLDPAAADYRLAAGSPAIDAGDNSALSPGALLDLAGATRRFDDPATPDTGLGSAPLVDLGAYEFQGDACRADLSGSSDPNSPAYGVPDGAVDASDFFYYLDQFAAANLAIADLSGSSDPNHPDYGVPDGAIDAADFFYYLDLFVAGCP